MELQSTSLPTRKQPARNKRDRGCQTIDFKTMVEMEIENELEEERKYFEIQAKELKKKVWCVVCQSRGTSKAITIIGYNNLRSFFGLLFFLFDSFYSSTLLKLKYIKLFSIAVDKQITAPLSVKDRIFKDTSQFVKRSRSVRAKLQKNESKL